MKTLILTLTMMTFSLRALAAVDGVAEVASLQSIEETMEWSKLHSTNDFLEEISILPNPGELAVEDFFVLMAGEHEINGKTWSLMNGDIEGLRKIARAGDRLEIRRLLSHEDEEPVFLCEPFEIDSEGSISYNYFLINEDMEDESGFLASVAFSLRTKLDSIPETMHTQLPWSFEESNHQANTDPVAFKKDKGIPKAVLMTFFMTPSKKEETLEFLKSI